MRVLLANVSSNERILFDPLAHVGIMRRAWREPEMIRRRCQERAEAAETLFYSAKAIKP